MSHLTPEHDEGFTIIELMVAMMVMLIITVPLVGSFVIGTETALGSSQDVTNSADAQLLGYYFDIDVASAEKVSPDSSTCGSSGSLLQLQWTDGGTQTVTYRAFRDTARETELQVSTPLYQLERVACGPSSSTTVIARTLSAIPTVTCDGGTCAADSTPRRVGITLKERSTQQSDVGSSTTFTVGVTAVRKVTP